MKKLMLFFGALAATCFSLHAFASNIAWGKSVTLNGTYGTDQGGWPYYAPASASSLTDGVYEPEQETWNYNSVWWNGWTNPGNNIEINLGGVFRIDGFSVQADDNDTYLVEYSLGGGAWTSIYAVPLSAPYGLITRNTTLGASIWADALRFTATGGDGYYAVSEIQAYGDPVRVPEASTMMLMLSGIASLFWVRRRAS